MPAIGSSFRCSGPRCPAASRSPTARMASASAIRFQPIGRGSVAVRHYHRRGERCPPPAPARLGARGAAGRQMNLKPARELLVLGEAEVQRLLDIDELVEALAAAFVELSEGRTSVPARVAAR